MIIDFGAHAGKTLEQLVDDALPYALWLLANESRWARSTPGMFRELRRLVAHALLERVEAEGLEERA
jgi:hypothetical protein